MCERVCECTECIWTCYAWLGLWAKATGKSKARARARRELGQRLELGSEKYLIKSHPVMQPISTGEEYECSW